MKDWQDGLMSFTVVSFNVNGIRAARRRGFDRWLAEMQAIGYEAPRRADNSDTDRSQRDLDILRSMYTAGVPRDTAQTALEARSDKAQERGSPYVQHLMRAVWGDL